MKLMHIVNQLKSVLPKFTDAFSAIVSIDSVSVSGGVATFNSVAHGLTDQEVITVVGAKQKNGIMAISKDGLLYTLTTAFDHDLTESYVGYETVLLGGFTPTEWNTSLKLISVVDRRNFVVQSINTLPVLNGGEYLAEIRSDGINGTYPVSVPSADQFTVTGSFADGDYFNAAVKSGIRVAGTVSIERALSQYTEQSLDDLWCFVEMNDVNTSKNRQANSDALDTPTRSDDIRMRMIDGFSLFIVKNVTDEIAAVNALDLIRHDLLLPISKSLTGANFDTGLTNTGDFRVVLKGHGFVAYNMATLVYQYNFELSGDLTLDDVVDPEDTRAFTQVHLNQTIGGIDVDVMTASTQLPQ